ncbi:Ribosomal RNA large subunit methyltransferase I [Tetrabaena socialis]|uniref:Ribosomal RNA large subunit methyltransferase I n=1 Tax=Tetrabaena socialis TaxID=47790 RepID=A0A2J8A4G6_9CHLO|nr:Ribosomal RNA large subunit methyltransferase I [Tetrabaena socialis]|eukprot:PNH07406.1 Ribosomal RNA large subunit methyltransferase I [Tetrabaena socialis]
MGLIHLLNEKPVHLVLAKDRIRSVKRGHPWIFPEVLRELPRAPAGSLALLKTPEGEILAKGYYDPASKLAFRTFALQKDKLDDALVAGRLERAMRLRAELFEPYDRTNGFRLVNGEGDGLPGLVVDLYDKSAVMKLDGAGGFSVYAGVGGASHVTTVDVGRAALQYATANWKLNGLAPGDHVAAAVDAFEFLDAASRAREKWDVVIIDPPSFAPSKAAVEKAAASYTRLFAAAAAVTAPYGTLALASCSSHIDPAMFMQICEDALGKARRQGYVLSVAGQPADHPFPAAADELRYLKFVTYRMEG